MNKKQRLAMVLLVVAIVLSLISVVLNVSMDRIEGERNESEVSTSGVTQGTVQLTIRPQGTVKREDSR